MSFTNYLAGVLPQDDGYLPRAMLFVAATALGNTIQAFLGVATTRKLYAAQPGYVTPLSSRTFGVWTLTSSIVRFYAAYHLREKAVYNIAMWTYFIAFAHFAGELLVFKTARLSGPVIMPVLVSTILLTWMFLQYEFYVKP